MDRKIEKKKWPPKKLAVMIGGPLAFLGLFFFAINSRTTTYKTNLNKLSVGHAQIDQFQEMASFQATVEPLQTFQLDAAEGGVVEKLFAEEGIMVDSGQALIQLSNTTLRLDFMNRETQIIEQINNLRSTRITLDQTKRQVQEKLVDLEYDLKEQRRKFSVDSALYIDSTISETDYLASRARHSYLTKKRALLAERLDTDERYRQSQLARIDHSVEMMERNLDAIRQNLENLVVRAPISGQLNSFDHEIGETKSRGENLGRIDELNGYLLSALVDQFYLNRMQIDQQAKIEVGNKKHQLQISKIFPTVVNSQFEVQLTFVDSILPQNIRRGQNFQVQLELSASKEALLIPRGAYTQSNSGKYVYVIDRNTQEAFRRTVSLGSQNPRFVEVLSGLEAGEEIITSSYTAFGNAEKIILKQ